MNGAHMRALFNKCKLIGREKIWMDVYEANHNNDAKLKHFQMNTWKAYEALQPYMKDLT